MAKLPSACTEPASGEVVEKEKKVAQIAPKSSQRQKEDDLRERIATRKENGCQKEYSAQFPQMFVGQDGALYVKNCFNNDFASFAKYTSKKVYDFGSDVNTFIHVSHEEAMSQYVKEVLHEFTISVNGVDHKYLCNLVGELIERIQIKDKYVFTMKEYLKHLFTEHGRENVKFTHKEIENVSKQTD